LEEELHFTRRQVDELQSRYEEAENSMHYLIIDHENVVKALREQLRTAAAAAQEGKKEEALFSGGEGGAIKGEGGGEGGSLEALVKRVADLEKEISNLNGYITYYKRTIEEKNHAIAELKESEERYKARIAELYQSARTKEQGLGSSISILQGKVRELRLSLEQRKDEQDEEHEQQIADLNEVMKDMQKHYTAELQKKEDQVQELTEELRISQRTCEHYKTAFRHGIQHLTPSSDLSASFHSRSPLPNKEEEKKEAPPSIPPPPSSSSSDEERKSGGGGSGGGSGVVSALVGLAYGAVIGAMSSSTGQSERKGEDPSEAKEEEKEEETAAAPTTPRKEKEEEKKKEVPNAPKKASRGTPQKGLASSDVSEANILPEGTPRTRKPVKK
jgi:uncharacterized coiled-coil protein SlyX